MERYHRAKDFFCHPCVTAIFAVNIVCDRPSNTCMHIQLLTRSRKMNVGADVNFEELARSSDDFNAAQVSLLFM